MAPAPGMPSARAIDHAHTTATAAETSEGDHRLDQMESGGFRIVSSAGAESSSQGTDSIVAFAGSESLDFGLQCGLRIARRHLLDDVIRGGLHFHGETITVEGFQNVWIAGHSAPFINEALGRQDDDSGQ